MSSFAPSKDIWMVFDVDGVLVDPSESYDIAVKYTVLHLIGGRENLPRVEENSIRELRRKGRFGDDFDLTEVIVRALMSEESLSDVVNCFPRGAGIEWARRRWPVHVDRNELIRIFNTFYLGDLYDERSFEFEGLWKKDRVVVDKDLLKRANDRYLLGVITGRNELELRLACELIGFHFEHYVTRDMYMKPDPMCLKVLVNGMDGIYVGDTVNDELLVERYNSEFEGNFEFVMVGRDFENVNEFLKKALE